MHIITKCTRCGKDFMYHQTDIHLYREPKINIEIKKEFPIQDDEMEIRRWKSDKSDYCELSKWEVICHECDEIEENAKYIYELANHRGWENAERYSTNTFGEEKTKEIMKYIDDYLMVNENNIQ